MEEVTDCYQVTAYYQCPFCECGEVREVTHGDGTTSGRCDMCDYSFED